jgi:tetrahydromethanopterin S-methyltransferase subunit B
MDEKDRLKRFESALTDPEIAKFAPKTEPTLAVLVEHIRAEVKKLEAICDDIERVINSSVDEARKAADSLIELTKRVK